MDGHLDQEPEYFVVALLHCLYERRCSLQIDLGEHLGSNASDVSFDVIKFHVFTSLFNRISVLVVLDEKQLDEAGYVALDSQMQRCHSLVVFTKRVNIGDFAQKKLDEVMTLLVDRMLEVVV